jgi:hypothetical protein
MTETTGAFTANMPAESGSARWAGQWPAWRSRSPMTARSCPGVYGGSLAELAAGPQVLAEAASGVADDDERLARVRRVEYWYLLPMGWTAEPHEIATILKL